jgi:hypothetical protein
MSFIDLNSVGSTVTNEGLVFPIDCSEPPETAGEAEEMMGVHLLDTDSEWWNNMSISDCENLMGFLTPLFLNGIDFGMSGLTDNGHHSFIDWGMERLQYVINHTYFVENMETI